MDITNNVLRKFLYFFSKEKEATNSMRKLFEYIISRDGLLNHVPIKYIEITNILNIKSSALTISIKKLIDISCINQKSVGVREYKLNHIYAPPTSMTLLLKEEDELDYNNLKSNCHIISQDQNLKNSHRALLEYFHSQCKIEVWQKLPPPSIICKDMDSYTSTFHQSRSYLENKGYLLLKIEGKEQLYYIPRYKIH